MTSQLHKDLQDQIGHKLRVWAKDALALFEMADLPHHDCISAMAAELSYALVVVLKDSTTLSPKQFGDVMERTFVAIKAVHDNVGVIELEILNSQVNPEVFGKIPEFLDPKDPRPACEQFHQRYAHGGGWHPMKGWQLLEDNSIWYSTGDEEDESPLVPLAQIKFRNESIFIYDHAWVAIIQPDRSFEISRMD
jgi:hypothetical protein